MSTTTLRISVRVGGTLTDPDANAVTVSNVVRTDTGAVVLADPAAMTRTGTGSYSYALTDPSGASGLTYAWNANFSRNGVAQSPQLTTAQATGTPAGRYASLADLNAAALPADLIAYSNDGTEADPAQLNATQVQYWLTMADAWIDRQLTHAGITAPMPATDADFAGLTECAAQWTVAQLYRRRGVRDQGSDPDGKMAALLKGAQMQLSAIIRRRQQEGEAPVAYRDNPLNFDSNDSFFGGVPMLPPPGYWLDGVCGPEW